MQKQFQAKAIDDKLICELIRDNPNQQRFFFYGYLPLVPFKVVNAKLRACVLKGFIVGCSDSGCSNCTKPYNLTLLGQAYLDGAK